MDDQVNQGVLGALILLHGDPIGEVFDTVFFEELERVIAETRQQKS